MPALNIVNSHINQPIYTTSNISKVIGKNKENLSDADWKHPYDPKPTKPCELGGMTAEDNSGGTCCAYNKSLIFNIYKERNPVSLQNVRDLMKDMVAGHIAGFVMPQLPDGSNQNGGDGTILCIAGGWDTNILFNKDTYYLAHHYELLVAVQSLVNISPNK